MCQQLWKTQQWPQTWKRSVSVSIAKTENDKEGCNYHTVGLISHVSKVLLTVLQVKIQQYMIRQLPAV